MSAPGPWEEGRVFVVGPLSMADNSLFVLLFMGRKRGRTFPGLLPSENSALLR